MCAITALLIGAVQLSAAGTSEENWPQWRGPLGTGVAPKANPPVKWSESEGIKWKIKLPGTGSSTPIVWDQQIFVQTAAPTGKTVAELPAAIAGRVPAAQVQDQRRDRERRGRGDGGRPGGGGGFGSQTPTEEIQFVLLSVDRKDGKVAWQKTLRQEVPHQGHHQQHGYASSSPVTDGQTVFAYFGSRGLHALDMDGNLKWSTDFGKMRTKMNFGEGNSPALHGNTIIVIWDHEDDDFIVALDKTNGKELWRQEREEDTTWASPLVVEYEGKAQVVTSGTRRVRSYDLATGKLIWESEGLTPNVIPMPVADEERVYLMSGFRGNKLLAIKLGRTGDLTGTDAIAWSHDRSTPYVPSPLLYNGKLYFFSHLSGILSCFEARSGKTIIDAKRVEGIPNVYASPVAASGRIYLAGRDGAVAVIKEAASEEPEVLALNQLEDRFDASPAVVGNEIILRGAEYLYCLSGDKM